MTRIPLTGALLCARYAFAPNLYHYCGPDSRGEVLGYVATETADQGLTGHLSQFETLYPYLVAIAHANALSDPFDPKVVEAYWIGNNLLERVAPHETYEALRTLQRLPKRIPKQELKWLLPKIDQKARLHHSFHVFNVFTRTGHHTVPHTIQTMDSCIISWGEIKETRIENKESRIKIASQKLVLNNGTLQFVPAIKEVVVEQEELGKRLKPGDWVSVHWGFVCDKLSLHQVKTLERYTLYHLALANETL